MHVQRAGDKTRESRMAIPLQRRATRIWTVLRWIWLIGNLNDILWRAAQGIKLVHVECDSSHFLKETRMKKILIPCDGSDNALRAVRYAASVAKERTDVELELLNVQDPMQLGTHATRSVQEIEQMQAGEANRILQPARQLLDAEQVPYHVRCRVGSPAGEIAQHVYETHCDAVIMGTRGLGPIASVMIGSVATRVIHLVEVPVTLIK